MAVVRERLRDNPDELRNVASMRLGGWLRRRRVQRARAAKIEELQSKKRSIQVEKAVRRIQNAWRAKVKANRERRIYGRRDLAALTLQSMWHRHCGKLERQAELQGHELKKIGAIITIQAWFQRATARRHIRQLQRIRKRQRDHTMARKIQLRVRIVLSRFVLRAKKRDRKLEIYTSANTLQNKWRSRQQRKRWLEGLRQYKASTKIAAAMRLYLVAHLSPVVLGPIVLPKVLKHMNLAAPLVVEVHRCASLRSTDSALHAGTPSVFVTAYQQIEMPDPEERLTPRKSDAPKPNREHHVKIAHRQVATCHTEPAPRRTVTEWNESFVIGGLEGNGCLAFTIVLTSYSWKPSWVVLAFGVLRVYNARGEVEPRFEINCEHIIGVGYDVEDDTINVKVVGDKDYSFRIIVNEHKENDEDRGFIRRTWLRKLRRVCPKIVTNGLLRGQYDGPRLPGLRRRRGCVKVDDAPSRAAARWTPTRARARVLARGRPAFDGGEAYWLNIADVEAERFNQPQFIHIAKTGGSAMRRCVPKARRPHPYERFLSLFRHEVHYLRSGGFLWHGAGPASPILFFLRAGTRPVSLDYFSTDAERQAAGPDFERGLMLNATALEAWRARGVASLPQSSSVFYADGARSCTHVVRYDDLSAQLQRLKAAYGVATMGAQLDCVDKRHSDSREFVLSATRGSTRATSAGDPPAPRTARGGLRHVQLLRQALDCVKNDDGHDERAAPGAR
ncbi:hypothetical protein JL722_10948 [Aureococcus anophagefferens]|nr:hypothetical protein JL722_10948 [Aureococcus anophagefferens]